VRYKVVPEPRDRETLEVVHETLPLVPDSVEECCIRTVDRTTVRSRDAAREWVTFLRALGLAERTPRGFRRVRTDVDREALAGTFRRRVFGAREVLAALDDAGELTPDGAFDHLWPAVPAWERDRHTDPEAEWRERTRRLLEWARILGLVTGDGNGEAYPPIRPA
jgi:hypothetical protein